MMGINKKKARLKERREAWMERERGLSGRRAVDKLSNPTICAQDERTKKNNRTPHNTHTSQSDLKSKTQSDLDSFRKCQTEALRSGLIVFCYVCGHGALALCRSVQDNLLCLCTV